MTDATVELVLDPRTEALVRAEWEALAAAGHSSMAAHPGATNRPHVTVVSAAPLSSIRALGGAALAVPFAVTLAPPVLLGSGPRRVLARLVEPSIPLLRLHSAVHAHLGTTDDDWVPHVTLAKRLRLESLPVALDLLGPQIAGEVTGIRSYDPDSRSVTEIA